MLTDFEQTLYDDIVSEQIPDDMPEWAIKSMAEGTFFKDCVKRVSDLEEFSIWMTGCGYDFCQHEYFIQQRDKLLK